MPISRLPALNEARVIEEIDVKLLLPLACLASVLGFMLGAPGWVLAYL